VPEGLPPTSILIQLSETHSRHFLCQDTVQTTNTLLAAVRVRPKNFILRLIWYFDRRQAFVALVSATLVYGVFYFEKILKGAPDLYS
jgi:hypothetical protein